MGLEKTKKVSCIYFLDDGKEKKKGKSDGAPQNEFREPKSQFKRDEKQQEQVCLNS